MNTPHTIDSILATLDHHVEEIKSQFTVTMLGVFGSMSRSSTHTRSDLDVLVDFEKYTFDNFMDLKFYLEGLFNCPIDLVLDQTLKPALRPTIMKDIRYVIPQL